MAGDAMDLGTLGLAARDGPRTHAVWGAIAVVVGAAILDDAVSRGLDRETGPMLPRSA